MKVVQEEESLKLDHTLPSIDKTETLSINLRFQVIKRVNHEQREYLNFEKNPNYNREIQENPFKKFFLKNKKELMKIWKYLIKKTNHDPKPQL